MPLAKGGKMISTNELKQITSDIIKQNPNIPVSQIMRKILRKIAEISRQDVLPEEAPDGPKNTSGDDITLLCLEVESAGHQEEIVWRCENGLNISEQIVELYENLEAEWYRQNFEAPDVRLRLVLEEAILNAWKHGNREKPIHVRWRFGNDFTLEVLDQGEGFNFWQLPDPTIGDNRVKPSGRGLFIIRQFADFVDWKNKGSHILIRFHQYANSNGNRHNPIRLWESFN